MWVNLPVRGQRVAVVGSTERATVTTTALVGAGAIVTVVAAEPSACVVDLASRGLLTLHERNFVRSDIRSGTVIFALTGDASQDAAIDAAAVDGGVICIGEPRPDGPARPQRPSGTGRVILVGGGPGDPGLLTVAGSAALAGADVVVTDRLAPVSVLADLAPHATLIDVSKIPGGSRTEQHDINALLVDHARAGKTVVRLKGGDGFVFGRGGEELDHCIRAGIAVDVIPGVSSAIAAPASASIPVTHRGLTQGFTVVSGHVPPGHPDSDIDYYALARANTTIVLMMAVANLDAITGVLLDAGMDADTPAAVVSDGSLSSQSELRATLGTVADAAREAGVRPPATTIIGAVAGFVPGGNPVSQPTTVAAMSV